MLKSGWMKNAAAKPSVSARTVSAIGLVITTLGVVTNFKRLAEKGIMIFKKRPICVELDWEVKS